MRVLYHQIQYLLTLNCWWDKFNYLSFLSVKNAGHFSQWNFIDQTLDGLINNELLVSPPLQTTLQIQSVFTTPWLENTNRCFSFCASLLEQTNGDECVVSLITPWHHLPPDKPFKKHSSWQHDWFVDSRSWKCIWILLIVQLMIFRKNIHPGL